LDFWREAMRIIAEFRTLGRDPGYFICCRNDEATFLLEWVDEPIG